jgi:hypothetical protein
LAWTAAAAMAKAASTTPRANRATRQGEDVSTTAVYGEASGMVNACRPNQAQGAGAT